MTPTTWKFRPSCASAAKADARLTMWDQQISPANSIVRGFHDPLSTNHYPLTSSPVLSSSAQTSTAAMSRYWEQSPGTSAHPLSLQTPGSVRAPARETSAGCCLPETLVPIHPPGPPRSPKNRSSKFTCRPDATPDRLLLRLTPATSPLSTEMATQKPPAVPPPPTPPPPSLHPARTLRPAPAPVRLNW